MFFTNSKVIFFLILGLIFTGESDRFLEDDEVHYRHDQIMRNYWQGKKQKALREMQDLCSDEDELSFFHCYNAAILYRDTGNRKLEKDMLIEAIKQKPQMPEALNSLIQRYPGTDLGVLPEQYRYYESARAYAHQKNKEKTLAFLERAVEAGFHHREALTENPDFTFLEKSSKFRALTGRLLESAHQKDRLVLAGSWVNALTGMVDVLYTYDQHRKQPDHKKKLYYYYEALTKARQRSSGPMLENLKDFFTVLEGLQKQHPERAKHLPQHALVYVWQHKDFKVLRNRYTVLQWFHKKADAYSIEKSWFK